MILFYLGTPFLFEFYFCCFETIVIPQCNNILSWLPIDLVKDKKRMRRPVVTWLDSNSNFLVLYNGNCNIKGSLIYLYKPAAIIMEMVSSTNWTIKQFGMYYMAWKMSKICYEKMLCFFMNGAYFRGNRISSAFYIKSYYLIYRSINYLLYRYT